MAFNPAPSHWLPALTADNVAITIPLAAIPEVTAAEANPATGDIRKVAYGIIKALADNNTEEAVGDRPGKMQIVQGQALNAAGNIVKTYSFTFELAPANLDVAAEV